MIKEIVFFDLETTGTNPVKDRIVEISARKTDLNFNPIDDPKIYKINPTIPIPSGASEVHGIYDFDVFDCPTFEQLAKNMNLYFSNCHLAGYNIYRFDVPLLSEEFARFGYDFPSNDVKIIDPCIIFKKREARTLSAAYKFFCGKDLEGAHNADIDNLATIEVAESQKFIYGLSLEEMISETMEGSEKFLDFDRKIYLDEKGEARYAFGTKAKDVRVIDDRGFAEWMLKGDFSRNTKNVVRKILNIK